MQIHGSQNQKFILLILILFSYIYATDTEIQNFSYVPSVKVLLSDTEIVSGHVIRIKIRADGDKVRFPNIEEIDGVPVLEQHERITNKYHYINGVLNKERTTLILTFAPHHDVTIPSYDIEIDGKIFKTKPVKIKVVPSNAQNKEDENKFFLHLKTDKKSVIVGEPLIVTVYFSLKNGVRLSENPQYTQPLFKGFFVKLIGDEEVYSEGNRQITKLQYLLTPLSEGSFNVGPAKVKIGVPNRSRRDMFGRITGTTWIPIVSNTIKIHVDKKPKESDLVGNFTIESHLDREKTKANKPVNLTIKIVGDGIVDDFEFPNYDIDGVTVYSDDAQINTEVNQTKIQSSYSKSFVFISDRSFTIPSQRISIYDLKSKTVKYLEVPSYEVEVKGSNTLSVSQSTMQISHNGKVYNNVKSPQRSMLDIEEKSNFSKIVSPPLWMIVFSFILGFLVMYFIYYSFSRRWKKVGSIDEDEAFKILYVYMNESKEIEDMVRLLYAKRNGDQNITIDQTHLNHLVKNIKQRNENEKII